ncbi:hypothetical protein V502_02573 [Pseudogymnoascus sp. VKM F-4520 (FW-2644)]|nr:hypothetical protein V502_02573 [Pseudogymnoascus sp. VKM F-4520 (FW-2644)]
MVYDKLILMNMGICDPTDTWFELHTRDSEAVIFVYRVSDRQKFLELLSAAERACNAITPRPVIPQPGRGVGLVRRILSRLHLRHSEAQPPPPFMVLAVSDMDPKSKRLRQVTSEEGESFSRSIGAIFLEISCAPYTVIANPEVKDEAMIELSKRVILNRAYAEKLAKEVKVVK